MKLDVTPFVSSMKNMSGTITKALSMHAPEIAAVTGTVGFLTALGLMYKQSPKIHKDIEEENIKSERILKKFMEKIERNNLKEKK